MAQSPSHDPKNGRGRECGLAGMMDQGFMEAVVTLPGFKLKISNICTKLPHFKYRYTEESLGRGQRVLGKEGEGHVLRCPATYTRAQPQHQRGALILGVG